MSEQEHEVRVVVTGDVRDFQNNMRKAGNAVSEIEKRAKRFAKDNKGMSKDMLAVSKKIKQFQKPNVDAALKQEKKLAEEMKKVVAVMKEKLKVSKGNVDAIKDETRALARLESAYAKSQKNRKKLGEAGKSWREKAGDTAGSMGRGAGSLMRGAAGLAMGGAATLLGLLLGRIGESYATYTSYGHAQGGNVGLGTGKQLKAFRGARYGYSATEVAGMAGGVARQTGYLGAVDQAMATHRAIGADVGEVSGWMGTLRRGGNTFTGPGGGRGTKELEKVIAHGMETGIERARLPEQIAGVMSLVERQRTVSVGDIGAGGFSAFMTMLGKSGKSGFQGAAGAEVASKIDAALRGSGDQNVQALIMQSLGFGKPGGSTSYMDALRMQEKGLSDPTTFLKAMGEMSSQFGRGDERSLAMKNAFGVSIEQADELGKLYDSGKMSSEELERLRAIAEAAEPVEKQALKEMQKGFGGTVKYLANLSNDLTSEGGAIAGSIRTMQTSLNDVIRVLWEPMSRALEVIAEVVSQIRDFIVEKFGGGKITKEKLESDIRKAREDETSEIGKLSKVMRVSRDAMLGGGAQAESPWARFLAGMGMDGQLTGARGARSEGSRQVAIAQAQIDNATMRLSDFNPGEVASSTISESRRMLTAARSGQQATTSDATAQFIVSAILEAMRRGYREQIETLEELATAAPESTRAYTEQMRVSPFAATSTAPVERRRR